MRPFALVSFVSSPVISKCSSAVRVCRIVSPISSDNFANEVTNCPRLIFVPFTHPIFQFAQDVYKRQVHGVVGDTLKIADNF